MISHILLVVNQWFADSFSRYYCSVPIYDYSVNNHTLKCNFRSMISINHLKIYIRPKKNWCFFLFLFRLMISINHLKNYIWPKKNWCFFLVLFWWFKRTWINLYVIIGQLKFNYLSENGSLSNLTFAFSTTAYWKAKDDQKNKFICSILLCLKEWIPKALSLPSLLRLIYFIFFNFVVRWNLWHNQWQDSWLCH